ncbi:hypothetical protein V2J09_018401, partial [Rumex salicifolius]
RNLRFPHSLFHSYFPSPPPSVHTPPPLRRLQIYHSLLKSSCTCAFGSLRSEVTLYFLGARSSPATCMFQLACVYKFFEMETLVAVVQQGNQYYSRGKARVSGRLDSSTSKGFGEINCRTFESSRGLLSAPFRTCSTPVSNRSLSSPKTPNASVSSNLNSKDGKPSKKNVKSIPIAIDSKCGEKERIWNNSAPFSELWAGPAYSNSPPPSSLPMPKFPLPRRTVSLELPPMESEIDLHPIAKSAPTSPTRELKHSAVGLLQVDDSATKTLRRILNLDIYDPFLVSFGVGKGSTGHRQMVSARSAIFGGSSLINMTVLKSDTSFRQKPMPFKVI